MRQFQKIGANKIFTGVLILIHQFMAQNSIKLDQFQLAILLDAKLNPWPNQILEAFGDQQTGVNKMSTTEFLMNQQFTMTVECN